MKDGLTILTLDGSLAANRLFLEQSWIIVEKQSTTTNSVDQTNCRIKKQSMLLELAKRCLIYCPFDAKIHFNHRRFSDSERKS